MINETSKLNELRADFLAGSTRSMPIAGIVYWAVIAVAALYLNPNQLSLCVLFGSGMIFPFGVLIDRLTGRKMTRASTGNPVMQLFMRSLGLVALMWPLVIIAARLAHNANLIVLGGAILMGIIWIPYGWAADDPVGLEHAIGRSVLSYAAYLLAPGPTRQAPSASRCCSPISTPSFACGKPDRAAGPRGCAETLGATVTRTDGAVEITGTAAGVLCFPKDV